MLAGRAAGRLLRMLDPGVETSADPAREPRERRGHS
jgi:hypothetical protein